MARAVDTECGNMRLHTFLRWTKEPREIGEAVGFWRGCCQRLGMEAVMAWSSPEML